MNLKQYGAKNFWLTEFVPKEVYETLGDESIHLMDKRIFVIVQVLRMYIDAPITINSWYDGGNLNERGFRLFDTITGGLISQHKLGKAIDISWDFSVKSIDVVIGYLMLHRFLFMQLGLGAIGVYPWGLHLDTREIKGDDFLVWKG